jgi:dTDP-4-dehydrorhamnose 3,5-epimerase
VSKRFRIHPLSMAGLVVIDRLPIADPRGFLERLFCPDEFADLGLRKPIAQVNRTLTRHKGTVRGMHFQIPPHAEIKMVSCLRGEVFDIAVDLRAGSPTFLQWHGETLTGENHKTFYIPEGFAHGFQTLTADCEMLYLHTAPYAPASEAGISHAEPRVDIVWPLPVIELSARDAEHPPLPADYAGLEL